MAAHLRWGTATDVGRVRSHNEDSSLVNDLVFAVADGMGGHRGGAVASQVALESLGATFTEPSTDALVAAAHDANEAVFERASDDPELRGMGTTLVAIAPVDDEELVAWVHVGDSRIYLFRDGELEQLTEDHSLVEQWVREGTISPEEARSHPQRNILTRALGIGSDVGIDAGTVIPYTGDRFVLCSDGLFNEVDEPRIESTLRRLADPEEASRELVRQAVDNGGRDNITVIVVDVVDDDDAAMTASAAVTTGTVEGHADKSPATASKLSREERKQQKHRQPRPRRITWRVVLFAFLILAIVAGGAAAIGYQARSTYFVGFNGDSVVIFKGKPGGVLWFDPTVERVTGLTRAQIPPSEVDRITNGQEENNLGDAEAYVQSIRDPDDDDHHDDNDHDDDDDHRARRRGDLHGMIAILRRRTELGLILLGAVIVGGAYTLASLGRTSSIPANIGPFLGIILALFIAAHIATRKLAPGADGLLLPIAALLNGIGYVMIARLDEASRKPQGLAAAQAGWTVIGIGAFIVTLIVVRRARDLQRYRYTFLLLGLLLLMAPLAPVIGREINGARIWAYIGPINFQPGEFAKVVLAIFFASYLVEKRELLGMATWPKFRPILPDLKHLGPVVLAWGVSIVIMTAEKDLGSSLLFFALFMLLVWVATGRAAYVLVGAVLFAAAAFFSYKTFGHVQERVDIWLDPWKDYSGSGFQVAQSWFAMAWGGVAGTGLGLGNPNQIPVVTTDFVFAAIGEEMGMLGASAVIFCFILLVGCGLRIAVRAEPPFEKLLAAGLTILLGVQSFIIMAGVTRLLPLTGVTLPFVSYGGSSLVANYVLLALLVRISDDTARRVGEVATDGKAAVDPADATRVT